VLLLSGFLPGCRVAIFLALDIDPFQLFLQGDLLSRCRGQLYRDGVGVFGLNKGQ
jgi:hypothetical protein